MYTIEQVKEIAFTSAIMADHTFVKFYEKMNVGYIATAEYISDLAIEFYEKYKDIDFNTFIEDYTPVSGAPSEIICYDELIIDFAEYKLQIF